MSDEGGGRLWEIMSGSQCMTGLLNRTHCMIYAGSRCAAPMTSSEWRHASVTDRHLCVRALADRRPPARGPGGEPVRPDWPLSCLSRPTAHGQRAQTTNSKWPQNANSVPTRAARYGIEPRPEEERESDLQAGARRPSTTGRTDQYNVTTFQIQTSAEICEPTKRCIRYYTRTLHSFVIS